MEECEILYGIRFIFNGKKFGLRTLKKIRKRLYKIKEEEGIVFVHGIGKRKSQIQKSIETLEEYMEKLKEYTQKIHLCGDRNSYSKTDPDATFMRMKEDHMQNGQLKPAYNLQHGVDSEYITWLDVTQRPTDTRTLIPFVKDMEEHLSFHYRDIVADAGYESEENYLFLEENGQTAYIKPNIFKSRISERIRGRAALQRSCFLLCSSAIRRRLISVVSSSPTEMNNQRNTGINRISDAWKI